MLSDFCIKTPREKNPSDENIMPRYPIFRSNTEKNIAHANGLISRNEHLDASIISMHGTLSLKRGSLKKGV